jgi:3-oxoacyl-[acyl-carrier protein] reductase
MSKPLDGKIALVTGSSRGIGAAIAVRLAEEGADVVVHYTNDEVSAAATANTIALMGRTAWIIRADLAAPDGAIQLIDALPFNTFDILVNSAAVISYAGIGAASSDDFERIIAVNVRSVFRLIQQAHSRLNSGGRIINISSAAARVYFPAIPAYAASKGFMEVLTLHVAPEFAARDITVNCVAPGVTDTHMSAWIHEPGGSETLKQMQVLNGIGKPQYVAGVVSFLAGLLM